MSTRLLALATAAGALIFGVGHVVLPEQLLAVFGLEVSDEGLLLSRFEGAFLLGFTALNWYARDEFVADGTTPNTRRAVIFANLVATTIALGVALHGQLAGLMNAFGWALVALFLVLVAGWAYAALRPERESGS